MRSKRRGLWVAVSTQVPTSTLGLEGSAEAFKLWVVGLCLCRQEEGDGSVAPRGACRIAGVELSAADELVGLGSWHRPGHDCPDCPQPPAGRVRIHAYENWQDTGDEIEARSEAGRKAARMRWAKGDAYDSNTEGEGEGEGEESSSNSLVASSSSNSPTRNRNRGPTAAPDSLWPPSDAMRRWAQERGFDNDHWLSEETDSFLNWARSKNKRFADWEAAWKNWVRRSAESSGWAPARPAAATELELEGLIEAWLWTHPCPHPEELTDLMRDDPAAYEEAMRPVRAQWREHARAEVLREQGRQA